MNVAKDHRNAVEARARELAAPLVAGEGAELVEVEFLREREGWVLRLFIDKPGGVGLEDCEKASRAVETVLEVEDVIPNEYRLEVSSPGLDRPLTKREHFERVQGERVKVKTFGPVGEPPRKNFTGRLKAVEPEAVQIEVDGAGEFRIPFKDIAKANLEFSWQRR
jgi:ribosome maturation factor RimP